MNKRYAANVIIKINASTSVLRHGRIEQVLLEDVPLERLTAVPLVR